jgi:hypothetical protein
MFRNKHGNAEFAIQLVRDAKGMTHTPDKRYEISVHTIRAQSLIRLVLDPSAPFTKV